VRDAAAPARRVIGSARVGAAAVGLLVVWLVFGVYVLHTRMPTTALTLPAEGQLKPVMVLFVPEGWAFFTKSPRDDRLLPFARSEGGEWAYINRGPNAELRNWLGINRSSRAQGPEMGGLMSQLRAAAWQSCRGDPRRCLEEASVAFTGRNPSPTATLCGTVGIVLQEPLPWAWYGAGDRIQLPSRVTKLEVAC